MDYIRFVNSQDIRKYLYDIDYHLNGEHKLFIVDNCYRIPLEERLMAMQLLLDEPDEHVIIKNPGYFRKQGNLSECEEVESLHELTAGLIKKYQLLTEILKEEDPLCYYEVKILRKGESEFYTHSKFPSFKSAVQAYKDNWTEEDRKSVAVVQISKIYYTEDFIEKWEQSPADEMFYENIQVKYVRAFFDSDLNLMRIFENRVLPAECFFYTTDKLFIYLPMPFKRGDILVHSIDRLYAAGFIDSRFYEHDSQAPFVAESFNPDESLSKGSCFADIYCKCLFFYKYSQYLLRSEDAFHFYDLEYYRKPLRGKDRFLRILSMRLNDEKSVSYEELFAAYEYFRSLVIHKDIKKSMYSIGIDIKKYLSNNMKTE